MQDKMSSKQSIAHKPVSIENKVNLKLATFFTIDVSVSLVITTISNCL